LICIKAGKGNSLNDLYMQESESIEGVFPATAMPDAAWWQALWPQPEKVLADIGMGPGMHVVDLCCGDGLFTTPLVKMAGRVIAIDLDPKMVDLARMRVAAVGRRTALSSWAMPTI
jgi:cyclopropane fatty-acyl-phospholipid synthase-like methyltransferase